MGDQEPMAEINMTVKFEKSESQAASEFQTSAEVSNPPPANPGAEGHVMHGNPGNPQPAAAAGAQHAEEQTPPHPHNPNPDSGPPANVAEEQLPAAKHGNPEPQPSPQTQQASNPSPPQPAKAPNKPPAAATESEEEEEEEDEEEFDIRKSLAGKRGMKLMVGGGGDKPAESSTEMQQSASEISTETHKETKQVQQVRQVQEVSKSETSSAAAPTQPQQQPAEGQQETVAEALKDAGEVAIGSVISHTTEKQQQSQVTAAAPKAPAAEQPAAPAAAAAQKTPAEQATPAAATPKTPAEQPAAPKATTQQPTPAAAAPKTPAEQPAPAAAAPKTPAEQPAAAKTPTQQPTPAAAQKAPAETVPKPAAAPATTGVSTPEPKQAAPVKSPPTEAQKAPGTAAVQNVTPAAKPVKDEAPPPAQTQVQPPAQKTAPSATVQPQITSQVQDQAPVSQVTHQTQHEFHTGSHVKTMTSEWEAEPKEEEKPIEHGPTVHLAEWQPEHQESHTVVSTAVPHAPADSHGVSHVKTIKTAWQETKEKEKPMEHGPTVHLIEWQPEHQELLPSLSTVKPQYQPGKVGPVWPPPQEAEERKDYGLVRRTELNPEEWIQHESVAVANRRTGAPWARTLDHASKQGEVMRIAQVQVVRKQWPPPPLVEPLHQFSYETEGPKPLPNQQRQWPPEGPVEQEVQMHQAVVHESHGHMGQVQRPTAVGQGFKPVNLSRDTRDVERPVSPTPLSPGQSRFPEQGAARWPIHGSGMTPESTQTYQTTQVSRNTTKVTRQWPPPAQEQLPEPQGGATEKHSPVYSQSRQMAPGYHQQAIATSATTQQGFAHPGPAPPPKPATGVPQQSPTFPMEPQQVTYQTQQQYSAPVPAGGQIPLYQSAPPKGWPLGGQGPVQRHQEAHLYRQGNMEHLTTISQASQQQQYTDPGTGTQYVHRFQSQQKSTVATPIGAHMQQRWPQQ